MNFLSLFSGIGAFEKALDRLGIEYNLVNYCEIDKYASKSYAAVHNVSEDLNLGDITQVDTSKLPHIDMISYGFPCQDISLAGKQKGFFNEDGTQTRSGLFFEALRIIEDTQPKVAIAENVKNLVSKKFNAQFQIVLESLEQAGYTNYWKVLNAKDYGIPQNRERVFIVSIRKDIDTGCFKFPEPFELELRLKDLLEPEVDEKFYINREWHFSTDEDEKHDENEIAQLDGMNYKATRSITDVNKVCRCLDTMGEGQREPKVIIREATKKGYAEAYEGDSVNLEQPNSKTRRGRVGKQVAQTLTTSPAQGVVTAAAMRGRYNESGQAEQQIEISDRDYANAITTVQKDSLISFVNGDVCKTVRTGGHGSTDRHSWDMVECNTSLRIRKLTPLECWRLQGFDDDSFYKAEKVCSNTQLYKQAGNSITVDVLEYLFKELMEALA